MTNASLKKTKLLALSTIVGSLKNGRTHAVLRRLSSASACFRISELPGRATEISSFVQVGSSALPTPATLQYSWDEEEEEDGHSGAGAGLSPNEALSSHW